MLRARHLAPPALALLLGLAGCTTAPASQPGAGGPASSTGAPLAGDAGAALPGAGSSPTWNDRAAADAVTTATQAVDAYIRKDLDPVAWYAHLAPHLTPEAATAYLGTDPALVPGSILAQGTTAATPDAGSAFLARVPVATDAGVITALLVRAGAGAPWRVSHFDLPAGGGAGG